MLSRAETTGQGDLSFHWEVIDKPIKDIPSPDGGWDQPVLKLQELEAGSYKFRSSFSEKFSRCLISPLVHDYKN